MHTVSRLLDQFIPAQYTLSLDIHRPQRTFSGTVSTQGELVVGQDTITFHAKDLVIDSVLIDGRLAQAATGTNDELRITQDDLQPGKHIVVIGFHGHITDTMHGLYPCYYTHAGVEKELIATQFESHHAREVFPCIDEPEAKATFDVTLTTEDDITVLGNMPVAFQDSDGQRMTTKFETTPRMSTYLLAFVAGELQRKTATTKDNVEVNVWATPVQPAESLDFALDIAVRSIEFYNDYFGTAYPLPKSDHVALPDFSSGAMENWGLITYREIALLADPKHTSISSKQYIATVIAHELAHQWFGNLVTMKWWNNLWLNESFATMMEYIAVDALHPEWNCWLDFATNESIIALRRDSLAGVQAVQVDVNHPDEISTLFDGAIVYAKGARLLRMLQQYIGDDAFQHGLKEYFAAHAYGNTDGEDLWAALSDASGKDIAGFMNTWISQSGYPVLHVSRDDDTLTLTQEQFFTGPHDESSQIWPIPLVSTIDSAPALLETPSLSLPVASTEKIRFNVGDSAHFITHYDESLMQQLSGMIADDKLTPIDRLQLLDEATMLARGGVMSSAQLITLLESYKHETSEPVWNIIAMTLAELRKFVDDNPQAETKLRALSESIAQSQYDRLGWEAVHDEPEEDSKLRSTVIGLMLYGENADAISTAKRLYDDMGIENLDPELRPLVISSVTRHGDETIVDELLQAYIDATSGDLRQDICVGITSTKSPAKIAELLDAIKNDDIVRPQDAARWFIYLVRGRESRAQAWQWIRDNWQWVIDTFGGDKSYDDYPRYSASALTTQQQLDEYIAFFEPKKEIPALTRVITIGISEIEGRVALIERDKHEVQQALLAL
jgi:aminopeptidase N